VKKLLGLQTKNLGSILEINDYDKFFGKLTKVLSDKSTINIGYLFNGSKTTHTGSRSRPGIAIFLSQ
jgi:hypothetical protein